MRSRWLPAVALALVVAVIALQASPAFAAAGTVAAAQDGGGQGGGGQEGGGGQGDGGEGQDDPDAETGAGEEEQESAVPEEGPPWTYQMAKISLLGLALLLLACAYLYWRLVVVRRRGET